jgi:hypothetical protein
VAHPPPPPVGLCGLCRHQQEVRTGRGSVFSLCRRSKTDPAFPKYPQVPVLRCHGFEPRESSSDDRTP